MESHDFMFGMWIFTIIIIGFIAISNIILTDYLAERFNFTNHNLEKTNQKIDLINQKLDDKTIILKQNNTIKNESIIVITDEYNTTKYYYYKIK